MRKSRFTDEQIVAILAGARPHVGRRGRQDKVSDQTIYGWRKHFAGLAPSDVERLKALALKGAVVPTACEYLAFCMVEDYDPCALRKALKNLLRERPC